MVTETPVLLQTVLGAFADAKMTGSNPVRPTIKPLRYVLWGFLFARGSSGGSIEICAGLTEVVEAAERWASRP